jgi:hypothetical protein
VAGVGRDGEGSVYGDGDEDLGNKIKGKRKKKLLIKVYR